MSFVLPQGLQTQRPTEARLGCQQQGLIESFRVPMLQWQKYRTSLEKWLSSSQLPPPLHSCWWWITWRKGASLWGAYNSQRKILWLSPTSANSGSLQTLLQHTTIAQLKVIQSCCSILKNTTEMGLLMDNCILAYTAAGVTHILLTHCQKIYKKRWAKVFQQMNDSTRCFFLSEIAIQQVNFKRSKRRQLFLILVCPKMRK